jgi:aryl-alcohol dehydrogenase-like predicted oxidoreductase
MPGFTHLAHGMSRGPKDSPREGGFFRERIGIHAMGFGALHLSLAPRPPEAAAIDLIVQVLDHGVRLIDTADCYCYDDTDLHHNESLIFKGLQKSPVDRGQIIVATKGGLVRPGGRWIVDGNPDRLRSTIARSFAALGGETPIDLWQLHAPDPRYSIGDTMDVLREAQNAGFIARAGL